MIANNTSSGPRRYPRRYPWGNWFRKKMFVLIRGIDYDSQVHGMASSVRTAAAKHGVRVSLGIEGDRITVTVLPPGTPPRRGRMGPR